MKTALIGFLPVAAALAALPVSGAPDGGVTFDFAAASARLFPDEASSENLAAGASWSTGVNVQRGSVRRDDPVRRAVYRDVTFDPPGADGSFRHVGGPGLVKTCGGEDLAKEIASSRTTYVALPNTNGGLYRVSFRYSMRHDVGERGHFYVAFRGPREPGRSAALLGQQMRGLSDTPDGRYSRDYLVPPGTASFCMMVRFDGVGELVFRDVSLRAVPPEPPVVLVQAAQGFFTPRFEFGEGQAGIVCWHWRHAAVGPSFSPSDLRCVLTVPKGFSLRHLSFADISRAERRVLPDGSVEYRSGSAWFLRPKKAFANWHRLGAVIVPEGVAGTGGQLSFRVESKDGTALSRTVRTSLAVTERVKAAAVPSRFVIGVTPGGMYFNTRSPDTDSRLADMMADAGVRGILSHSLSPECARLWRGKGFRQVMVGSSMLANGFIYGPEKGRPADERYSFLGQGNRYADVSACPVSCYSETEFFKSVTVPWIERTMRGADGFWSNWEPYFYARRGCMCGRCRAAFAAYAGVDGATLAAEWPKELGYGGKYAKTIEKFRSAEHGKAVKTLARHVKRFAGKDGAGFVPGIHWSELSSAWRPRNLAAEVQAIDYADALDWISPWGPYVHWDTASPYTPSPAPTLVTFAAARDVRRTVDADYPPGKRPRLQGFLSGNSYGTDWIAQPEWLEIQILSQFFNGWEATYFAGFPRGYDARYWRALARAAETVARHEPYVLRGKRCDGRVKIRRSDGKPFPRRATPLEYLDGDPHPAYVQHVAWTCAGRTLTAVFNFTDREPFDVDILLDGRVVRRRMRVPACRCVTLEK